MGHARFILQLPATAANLGPGFDTLGIAMTLHNTFEVTPEGAAHVLLNEGFSAPDLADPGKNLFVRAYEQTCRRHGVESVPLRVRAVNRVPMLAGIGSSATAIVGGVAAAYEVHDLTRDRMAMLRDALALESHPDNIGACLFGGFIAAIVSETGPMLSRTDITYPLLLWVILPQRVVSTEESRNRLPKLVSAADAVYSLSRASLLTAAFIKGDMSMLDEAMKDRLHEPYRMDPLMEYPVLKERLRGEEFFGWAVSGSGPAVIALCSRVSPRLRNEVEEHFAARGVDFCTYELGVDNAGLVVSDVADA